MYLAVLPFQRTGKDLAGLLRVRKLPVAFARATGAVAYGLRALRWSFANGSSPSSHDAAPTRTLLGGRW